MAVDQSLDVSPVRRRRPARRWISPVLLVVALAIAGYAIHRELRTIRPEDILAGFAALPWSAILASLGFTALSYGTLVGYDASAFRYLGIKTPWHRLVIGSFCGYAIANTAGFAVVTGTSVRYRIHARGGLTLADAGRIGVFTALAFAVGLAVTGALGLLVAPEAVSELLRLPRSSIQAVALLVLAGIAGLLLLSGFSRTLTIGRYRLALPSFRLSAVQLLLSGLDIVFAAAALYVLLPAKDGLSYLAFAAVFCAAIAAGVLSNVPGGVGVFDAVILSAFSWRVGTGGLIVALLAYRVIYFLVPFALALVTLAVIEAMRHRGARAPAADTVQNLGGVADALAPSVTAGAALIAAVVLLLLGATPAYTDRIEMLEAYLPRALIESAHFLSGVVASGLIFLSLGLLRRLNAAFWLTLLLLLLAAALALVKGLAYGEAVFLVLTALALYPLRDAFHRSTALLDEPLTPTWLASVALLLAGAAVVAFFAFEHAEYTDQTWLEFALDPGAPRSLRVLVAASVTALLLSTAMLLRSPTGPRPVQATSEDLEKAARAVAAQDRADANLVLLGDKSLLFSDSGRGLVMYDARGRSWVALGDPVGPADEATELIWRFREQAARAHAHPVFYLVSAAMPVAYIDAGLDVLRIGEEAQLPLQGFAPTGRRRDLSKVLDRARNDGLGFELVPPGAVAPLLPKLGAITEAWLAAKGSRETGFAFGRFDASYLQRCDVALVRRRGEPVAFANLLSNTARTGAAVDFYRQLPDLPGLVLAFLLTSLALELKTRRYRNLSLGMAPLAGPEDLGLSPARQRLAKMLFDHGERFYTDTGSRALKARFDPVWSPRYLACPMGVDPALLLPDVTALMSGR